MNALWMKFLGKVREQACCCCCCWFVVSEWVSEWGWGPLQNACWLDSCDRLNVVTLCSNMAALHWVSCSSSQRLYTKSSFSLWLVLKKLPTLACFACLLAGKQLDCHTLYILCSGWSLSIMWRARSLPSTSPNLRAIASMA